MKKLVIIGANDFQNQLILKAKALGYETHVFAWEEGAVGKSSADFFYPISITEKELILKKCQEIKPDGICSIASDLACITVNYVAESLGLPCNKYAYSKMQTNKYLMRQALQKAGLACPKFIIADNKFNDSMLNCFRFPIIVKPTDRSGSRCITKLESVKGLKDAINQAIDVSFEKKAIIEEYIDGDEYSMETITQNGIHNYLATTKKFTTGAPHFIESGHRQPSGLTENLISKAKKVIYEALDALHIENSAGHSEFKIDSNGNVSIIEIGARMGGDCIGSDLVYLSTGNDFMKMVIDVAVGNEIEVLSNNINNTVEIHFLFTQDDLNKLKNISSNRIYRISNIDFDNLGKTKDSSSRLGYYIELC